MADFIKVMREAQRMCGMYAECAGCPFDEKQREKGGALCCATESKRPGSTDGDLRRFEETVMAWSAAHPAERPLSPVRGRKVIRIFKLGVDGRCGVKHIADDPEALKIEVGGYIEECRIFDNEDLAVLVNTDGEDRKLPNNRKLPMLHGDIVIVGVKDGKYTSLSDRRLEQMDRLFIKR